MEYGYKTELVRLTTSRLNIIYGDNFLITHCLMGPPPDRSSAIFCTFVERSRGREGGGRTDFAPDVIEALDGEVCRSLHVQL